MSQTIATGCPVHHAGRKTSRGDDAARPAVEMVDGTWRIRSHDAVREVLRSPDAVQAGFAVEAVRRGPARDNEPVLYADGEVHRQQRKAIARFFAPATVQRRYRDLMESRADALVADIVAKGSVELSRYTLRYSIDVASRVVGLTNSDPDEMARRLEVFFEPPAPGLRERGRFAKLATIVRSARMSQPLLRFRTHDVQPAIEARRARREEDVISHLLDCGYSDDEILIECITYAAAGMVTTREYISMVTWHLLQNEPAHAAYLAGDQAGRYRILDEILRVEPVVGALYRRTTAPLTLTVNGSEVTIPAGARLEISVRGANADEDAVGHDPLGLCPARELASGVRGEAMAFGDGPHRCPGNAIAIAESDIFLTRLLAHPVRLVSVPHIEWDELISGYAIRGLRIAVG